MRTLIFLICILLGSAAQAAVVMDQYVAGMYSGIYWQFGGRSDQQLAQTFQVGVSGQLHHVSLAYTCSARSRGMVTIEIQGVRRDGFPDGRVLVSASQLASSAFMDPVWFRDVPFIGIALAEGQRYAIVLRADPSTQCSASQGPYDGAPFSYARGHAFATSSLDGYVWSMFTPQGRDLPFYTFMQVD